MTTTPGKFRARGPITRALTRSTPGARALFRGKKYPYAEVEIETPCERDIPKVQGEARAHKTSKTAARCYLLGAICWQCWACYRSCRKEGTVGVVGFMRVFSCALRIHCLPVANLSRRTVIPITWDRDLDRVADGAGHRPSHLSFAK